MATWDFAKLPEVMNRYRKSLPQAVDAVGQIIAEAGLYTVVQGTAVDTGRAISNWKVTIGAPFSSYVPTRTPGMKGGQSGGFLRHKVITEGYTIINTWSASGGQFLNIANNAPYIGLLNAGSSTQRPAGFIEKAVQNMRIRAKKIRILKMTEDNVYGKKLPKAGEV